MNKRAVARLSLLLALLFNAPGLVTLAGLLFKPLGMLTLLFLPFVVLWGLPGLLFHHAVPGAFRVTEFGAYPQSVTGWILLSGFWVVAGIMAAAAYARTRARRDDRDKQERDRGAE